MLLEIVGLVVGIILIVKASSGTIKSSIVVSKMLGISEVVIGFVLLAFATSLPELAVNILAIVNNEPILGVATLFGSNIADIALVFGAMGITAKFTIPKKEFDGMLEILVLTALIGIFVYVFGVIGFVFGLFGLSVFYLFMNRLVKEGFKFDGIKKKRGVPIFVALRNIGKILFFISIILISAHLITISASSLALSLGIFESFIGATIVAIGTSLPEVAVSVSALKNKNINLAIGNATGSLVANLTLVLGITSLFTIVVIDYVTQITILFMLLTYILFYILSHNRTFGRTKGLIMLGTYAVFLVIVSVGAV